jgi:hypothetical protein
MKKAMEVHIKEHQEAFDSALAKATICVRSCPALVGMNKIREPLAFSAALEATGYIIGGFAVPPEAGPPNPQTQAIVDKLFRDAVAAAS